MKEIIQRVKGTREFYPSEMALRNWLYQNIKEISESFGYQEYDGPFLEKLDLYAAKSGEELVKEQAFCFTDRGGDEITLRPELTPSLARMVAQKQRELVYPLRLWSFGPFWRYEQPQKGRTREFFQWNLDLIGAANYTADAELLSVCASFFKKVGLTPDKVQLHVNNRRLMDQQLEKLGISSNLINSAFRLIDRRDKMSPAAWNAYATELGLTGKQIGDLSALLENREQWKESEELTSIFDMMEKMGFADYLYYDPNVIRGILYYTGTVFEAWDTAADGRAILGGGRYENLVGDVGGDPLSGVGFAMGDVMISVILEKYGLIPQLKVQPASVVVTCFAPEYLGNSYRTAIALREAGINTICYPEPVKLDKQLKYANRIGAEAVVIAGPDEIAAGKVSVKDLIQHQQMTVTMADLADTIKKIIHIQ